MAVAVILVVAVVAALLLIPRNPLPSEGDCVWSVWNHYDFGTYGVGSEFTRVCSDCKAVQTYTTKPCEHLIYEDDGEGGVVITGRDSDCKCEFLYILRHSPDGKQVSAIGDSAFIDNVDLKFVYMEEGIKTVDIAAFAGCTQLLSAHMADSITTSVGQMFFDCNSLYAVNLPLGLTEIADYTFGGCWALREIVVHDGITGIYLGGFLNCKSLKEVYLPESVKKIGKIVFSGCENLEKVEMPGLEGSIPFETFGSCTSLKEFTVPKGVTKLESRAFFDCTALERINVHEGVSELEFIEGESPFIRCDENKLKVYCQVLAPVGTWSSGYDICNYLESQDEGGEEIPVRVEFVFGVNFEK